MKRILLLLPLALASCGTLPEPFYGNPGPAAARLAIPPAPVLMVPAPTQAMLDDKSAGLFAQDLASALVNFDVPSIAGPAVKANWQLATSAKLNGNDVVPDYAVIGPNGKIYGREGGTPIPAQQWANGDATALNSAALADAPGLSKLLAGINAKVQGGNPQSLENRPPRIFVGKVLGAPGDGDTALAGNLAHDLPGPDDEVVKAIARADFSVTANIKTQPAPHGQVLVELDWSVFDSNHRKIGQVTQLHLLMPSDISPYWGDVGAAAASEAATGIQQVVANAVLKKAGK